MWATHRLTVGLTADSASGAPPPGASGGRGSRGGADDDADELKEQHAAELAERREQIERLSQQLSDKVQLLQQVLVSNFSFVGGGGHRKEEHGPRKAFPTHQLVSCCARPCNINPLWNSCRVFWPTLSDSH